VRPREALQSFVTILSPLALPATLAWAQAAPTPRRVGAAGSGMREQSLFGLPIITMARPPLWRGSPATIEVAGQVPSPQARETTLRIVRAEAGRIRSDFQIEDRLAVVPPRAA
jgi:hypothetical protein